MPDRGGSSDREKELERRVESLERQLELSLAENARLRKQLEEALRANKRSAAPFSKGEPKSEPKPPGRKPGAAYGQRATRPVPSRVDEQIPVPLPPHCPHCHGPVILNNTQPASGGDDMTAPRTPAAWMIMLALSLTSNHTPTAWMISASIPNPVPGSGHFKRALPGHFWQAPKKATAVEILRKVKRTWGVLHDRYGAKKPSAALASIERFLDALDAAPS